MLSHKVKWKKMLVIVVLVTGLIGISSGLEWNVFDRTSPVGSRGNCSGVGSCSDVAYMDYNNIGNFNVTGNVTANFFCNATGSCLEINDIDIDVTLQEAYENTRTSPDIRVENLTIDTGDGSDTSFDRNIIFNVVSYVGCRCIIYKCGIGKCNC